MILNMYKGILDEMENPQGIMINKHRFEDLESAQLWIEKLTCVSGTVHKLDSGTDYVQAESEINGTMFYVTAFIK